MSVCSYLHMVIIHYTCALQVEYLLLLVELCSRLVLFGGFLLYDTQKIVYHAEHDHHYDPVNM